MHSISKLQRIYEEAYFAHCGYEKEGIKNQRKLYGRGTLSGDHVAAGLRAVLKAINAQGRK